MKAAVFWVLIVGWAATATGQGPYKLIERSRELAIDDGVSFAPAFAFDDATCKLGLDEVLAGTAWLPLQPGHEATAEPCTWYRVCLATDEPGEALVADLGYHAFVEFYLLLGDSLVGAWRGGNELPLAERAVPTVWAKTYRNLVPLPLSAGMVYEAIWRTRNPYGPTIYGDNCDQRLAVVAEAAVTSNSTRHLAIAAFLYGWLVMLLLYHLAQWAVSRSEVVGWYCALLAALLGFASYKEFGLHALAPGRVVADYWLALTACASFAVSFQFARVLLATVGLRGRSRELLRWFAWANVALGVVWVGASWLTRGGATWATSVLAVIPDVFRAAALGQLLAYLAVLIYAYRRVSGRAFRMFLVSSAAVVACVAVYLSEAYLWPLREYDVIAVLIGIVHPVSNYLVELGIALMGLGYAFAVALLTKERDLERDRVHGRSMAAAEMRALRSQMNPHFLFNGLNAVKRFVVRSQPREAADYLTKFAGLIRRVLQNSLTPLVPLAEELGTLRLYVELERLRFARPFAFELSVGSEVDTEALEVPAALIQPYVENAIWHGLYHLEEREGRLTVAVGQPGGEEGPLRVVVEDNGVGRATAGILAAERDPRRRSLGMALTAERMRLVERVYGIGATVEVNDLFDPEGVGCGTRVEVVIGVE